MILPLTVVLVVVAAVTLLAGLLTDRLALVLVSVVASALAGVTLVVASRRARRPGTAPPGASPWGPTKAPSPATPMSATPPTAPATGSGEGSASVDPRRADSAPPPPSVGVADAALTTVDVEHLDAGKVIARLGGLDLDTLEDLARREAAHGARPDVLEAIDARMDDLEAGVPAAGRTPGGSSSAGFAPAFPIADYDGLGEAEVIARLDALDADALDAVGEREESGANRRAVLEAIDDRLDVLEGVVPRPPARPT